MKKIKLASFFLLFLCIAFEIHAQQSHPTINNVEVAYKSNPSTGTAVNLSSIKAVPQATISLNASAGTSKIYFKILDNVTNAVLYQVNYSISSASVSDSV